MAEIQAQSAGHSLRILLVSENSDDQTQAMQALQPKFSNCFIQQAKDEGQFTLFVTHYKFDLALVDTHLSWAESLSVMIAIRKHLPDCPILMIVTHESDEILQHAIRAGLDGFVPDLSHQARYLPAAIGLALEQVRQRKALEEANGRYRTLFDTVPVGLYRTTFEGQVLDANLTMTHMLGFPDRESLLALNVISLYVNPQDRELWKSRLEQNATLHFVETQFRRRDGTPIWVELSVHPVCDHQNQILYYEGIMQDITARKRAEIALQGSEERFRTIVEQSPISIQVMTPEGWTIQVNRAWEKLWGVTAADVKNYNMLHDEQAISLGMMPYVERGFAGETVLMPPVAYHTDESVRNGRKRWFQARIYPITGVQGNTRNIIMMYEDITDFRWATEDLHRLSMVLMNAQEDERRRISQELHDELGQALTAMQINLDMLGRDLTQVLTSNARERLAEMTMLVSETLEHARELSHTLRPTMLDELGLVPTIRWYSSRCAERLGIQIDFEAETIKDRLTVEVETTLYRIVQEALTNVARHAQARHIRLKLATQEGKVSVLIEDDGVGFNVEKTASVNGTQGGIGLFGIRERVALWGGTFSIKSFPGQGARLLVEIPLVSEAISGEG